MPPFRIEGIPEWVRRERFDIIGKPHDGATSNALANSPSIYTALQEQLGLRLEPTRAPVEVLVIDSVERPTPD